MFNNFAQSFNGQIPNMNIAM